MYGPSVVGSRPEGGCTVNLNDVADEHFFNFDLHNWWVVPVMNLALLWRSNKPFGKKKRNPILLLKELIKHPKEKRLPNRCPQSLKRLRSQGTRNSRKP